MDDNTQKPTDTNEPKAEEPTTPADSVIPSNSEESQDLDQATTEEPAEETTPTEEVASEEPEVSEPKQEEAPALKEEATEPEGAEDSTEPSTEEVAESEESKPSEEPAQEEETQPEAAAETPAEESEEKPESDTQEEDDQPEEDQTANIDLDPESPGKWYVVHTYSGHENRVAAGLKQRIESEHLEDKILDILVPMQDKIEIRGGKKMEIKEKIFPGYILVKMILDDNTWLAVRTTQGVTSFVGMGNKPTPISNQEVKTIIQFTKIAQPTFKQVFSVNDTVKIIDGPFAEFIGKVDSVDAEKGKVRVLVSIFGRETPVELDFLQVQKI